MSRPDDDGRFYFVGTDGNIHSVSVKAARLNRLLPGQRAEPPYRFMFSAIVPPDEARPENRQRMLDMVRGLLGRKGKR